jgi:hypothetical protein
MMETGQCIEVLNPYDWLPGHGENTVEIHTQRGDLSVLIPYDSEQGELKKELLFRQTFAFYKSAFPGVSCLDFRSSIRDDVSMGSLVEYPDSEAARAWTHHFGGRFSVKHYRIVFMSENILLVVFATDFILKQVSQ